MVKQDHHHQEMNQEHHHQRVLISKSCIKIWEHNYMRILIQITMNILKVGGQPGYKQEYWQKNKSQDSETNGLDFKELLNTHKLQAISWYCCLKATLLQCQPTLNLHLSR
jgi:hypothetical protein